MTSHVQPDPSTSSKVILCASPRLAQGIRQRLQQDYQQQGLSQWQATPVYPLQDWLTQLTEHAILCGQIDATQAPLGVLSPTQEALLWEQAIQHCLKRHEATELFNTSGLASAAIEANRYLIEWNISLDMDNASEETRQFMQWRQQFQQLCRQSGYLESVRYQAWQLAQLQQHDLLLPGHLQLAGFDRINPHLQALIDTLQTRDVNVEIFENGITATDVKRMAFAESMDECRAAVYWAQQQLAVNPAARLAIVVPELDTLRETLANLLDDVFHPEALHPAQADIPRCYEFSLGLPLNRWPLVTTALGLLRLAFQQQAFTQPELSALLGDIYWSQARTEADARAALDAEMRQQLPLQVRNATFSRFVEQKQQDLHPILCPALHADLNVLLTLAKQTPRKQLPSAWVVSINQLLEATHWPGERSLSSHEYQCQQSFKRVLGQLAALDAWLGNIDAMSALHRLSQLCQAQIFQPQTVRMPNITLMGMLEASAQPLDGLWVMGMNDHIWPPLSRTNALIPAELQRQAGTPNASSEVQIAFASQIHQRLLCSAHTVIFSHAEKEGDRLLRLSPLIQAITEATATPGANTLAETLARNSQQDWQWLDDHQAPPIQEGEHISGGTGLLRAQALCPAWAFYQYRLKTRKLETPHNGLDAMQRGDLIHRVLAAFWSQQARLDWQTVSTEALKIQLDQIAADVIAAFNSEFSQPFSAVFCQLEAERLSKLALTWLWEVERERPQAFAVTSVEQVFKPLIEGIQVKLVIDRVDTLDDGRLVVIDYKTGSMPDFKNWASDKISEPQLPIYAAFLLQDADIAAVCFGKLRLTDGGFAGVAAEDDIVPGIKAFNHEKNKLFDPAQFPDWPSVLAHWHTQITRTAQALKAGEAAVVFESEQDLGYCDVLPLLRLPERQLQFEHLQAGGAA
ncbi:exodeoxyribonuclease-5 [Methylophilus rhizosphaerae]|uniref:Exodeoxyribonuclease-5 n=1 Tax=Methylophilus rhizosphaerae TaxID=492660 RepID=A0A1G9BGI2_9PROT|nr:PD-(D/E)XK nuclease family protein [Methylophilus rhizosphaerae]SDK37955.1 exodeoxyribonuclease-5 [Methylophilus rhizosphaerae]